MQYALVQRNGTPIYVAAEITMEGSPIEALFGQCNVGMSDIWAAECGTTMFGTEFHKIGNRRYKHRGMWHEAARDKVFREGGKLRYIARAGTNGEREYVVPDPGTGFYVPNDGCKPKDGIWKPFHDDTCVPLEVTGDMEEVRKRFEKYGLPASLVSMFLTIEQLGWHIPIRGFEPELRYRSLGEFSIDLTHAFNGKPPYAWLGSRPAPGRADIIGEIVIS